MKHRGTPQKLIKNTLASEGELHADDANDYADEKLAEPHSEHSGLAQALPSQLEAAKLMPKIAFQSPASGRESSSSCINENDHKLYQCMRLLDSEKVPAVQTVNRHSPIKFEDQKPEFEKSNTIISSLGINDDEASEQADLHSDSAVSDGRKSPQTRRRKQTAYRITRS